MDLKTVLSKGNPYTKSKRIGRGIGSGSGKTSGRGHKGRGARSGASRRPGYEGGQMPIYRRVPKRGFTNARFRTEYTIINVDLLNHFDDGATVDLSAVLEAGLVSINTPLFKVLGNGELTTKLTVKADKCSASAQAKIEAAGGTVVLPAGANAPTRSAAAKPTVDEPKAEKPKAEKPKAEKPKAEKPKAEKPKADEPKAEKPKAEKPKAEKPKAEKPKADEPKADEPTSSDDSGSEEPTPDESDS